MIGEKKTKRLNEKFREIKYSTSEITEEQMTQISTFDNE